MLKSTGSGGSCGTRGISAGLAGHRAGTEHDAGLFVLHKLTARDAPAFPQSVDLGATAGTEAVHLGVEGAIRGLVATQTAETTVQIGEVPHILDQEVAVMGRPEGGGRDLGVGGDAVGLLRPCSLHCLEVGAVVGGEKGGEGIVVGDDVGDGGVGLVPGKTLLSEADHRDI